jgi:hypothetical protein
MPSLCKYSAWWQVLLHTLTILVPPTWTNPNCSCGWCMPQLWIPEPTPHSNNCRRWHNRKWRPWPPNFVWSRPQIEAHRLPLQSVPPRLLLRPWRLIRSPHPCRLSSTLQSTNCCYAKPSSCTRPKINSWPRKEGMRLASRLCTWPTRTWISESCRCF